MDAVIPIIGHDIIAGDSPLRERIKLLIQNMGYAIAWADSGSIVSVHRFDPKTTKIPFVIVLSTSRNPELYDDMVLPLIERFRTCQVVFENLEHLASTLFRFSYSRSLWEGKQPSELLQRSIRYIYTNLANQGLKVEDICHASFVSKDTLESKFAQWKQCSIWKFVVHVRINEAVRLLEEIDDPIYNIGLSVGYDDLAAFDRSFKHHIGITPKAFRQKANNNRQKYNNLPLFSLSESITDQLFLHH